MLKLFIDTVEFKRFLVKFVGLVLRSLLDYLLLNFLSAFLPKDKLVLARKANGDGFKLTCVLKKCKYKNVSRFKKKVEVTLI